MENQLSNQKSNTYVIMGIQYGDEGKGKLVDEIINTYEKQDLETYCVRFNGGSNAGHSIWIKDENNIPVLYDTHVLPSGVIGTKCKNIIGCGVVVNIIQLFDEIQNIESKKIETNGRIYISMSTHVTFLIYKFIDYIEGKQFGSTGSGISQTIAAKANRIGKTMHIFTQSDWEKEIVDIYHYIIAHMPMSYMKYLSDFTVKFNGSKINFKSINEMMDYEIEFIKSKIVKLNEMITDTKHLLNNLNKNIPIIFEGANSIMLDPNVGYPNCTATNCTIGGLLTGTGISIKYLTDRNFKLIGVIKGYITRVGKGILITIDEGKDGETMQIVGVEFGTTTGRLRSTGWIDIPQINYANMLTGCDFLNITKLDVLSKFDKIKVCIGYKNKNTNEILYSRSFDDIDSGVYDPIYEELDGWKNFDFSNCTKFEELHPNVKVYISYIEQKTNIPIVFINTGKEQGQFIIKN